MFAQTASDVDKAENILIIGGGAVGVELAGEIRERDPKKHITIVTSGSTLLAHTHESIPGKDNDNFLRIN